MIVFHSNGAAISRGSGHAEERPRSKQNDWRLQIEAMDVQESLSVILWVNLISY